jgi:Universal stress protein UspA and related nucleotide-binding proteins
VTRQRRTRRSAGCLPRIEDTLDCADAVGADAVVLGATGRSGTERITLGGVAEKTVRAAPVPVVTVPGPGLAK